MIKVAFASKDGVNVNDHFGWCEAFYIYEIDENSFKYIKTVDSSEKKEEEGDKLIYKISCLDESDIVYVTQIGPKASAMVQSAGIYPMRAIKESEPIEEVIAALQKLMSAPPLWLKRIVMKAS